MVADTAGPAASTTVAAAGEGRWADEARLAGLAGAGRLGLTAELFGAARTCAVFLLREPALGFCCLLGVDMELEGREHASE